MLRDLIAVNKKLPTHKMAADFVLHKIAHYLDILPRVIGQWVAWLCIFLVLSVFFTVIMRYVFNQPSILLQEAGIWMHSMIFMLGIAYTLADDEHVRVDIFYRSASKKQQQLTDLLGTLFLLMPVCFYLISNSWHYVMISWRIGERSSEVGGLPGLYLLKSLLLVLPILLSLQGLSIILRSICRLKGWSCPDEFAQQTKLKGEI